MCNFLPITYCADRPWNTLPFHDRKRGQHVTQPIPEFAGQPAGVGRAPMLSFPLIYV